MSTNRKEQCEQELFQLDRSIEKLSKKVRVAFSLFPRVTMK
jgi:hypothetical protein